ncbi:MAG: polysaccharide biosynthesis tyrosine autokinase [Pyrinomonadaceae bacterium]
MRERFENALALREPEALQDNSLMPYTPSFSMDEMDEERSFLRDHWNSVRKRLWMITGLAVVISTLVVIFMLRKPDVYEAQARVRVDLENANPYGNLKNSPVVVNTQANDPAYFNTQLQVLEGPGLLRRVVKVLDLEHNPTFLSARKQLSPWQRLERMVGLGGKKKADSQNSAEEIPLVNSMATSASREDLAEAKRLAPYVDALQDSLSVEPVKETRLTVKETRLINIRFSHTDPQLAARVVNAISDSFVLSNLEMKTEAGANSGDFLQKRIAELQSQIRAGEEKLIEYAKNNQILSLDANQNTVVDRLTGLNKQLLEAENERKLNEAAFNAARNPGAAGALAEENAKNITDAEQKLSELKQKRAQLLVENTEDWPEVKEADEQIAVLEKQIGEMRNHASSVVLINLETRYQQSLQREQSLRSAFNQQRAETLTQNEAAVNYRIIQQEIETNKNLLDGLLQRSKENDVMLAGTPNNVRVVDYAISPDDPVGPHRLLGVVLAFALSIAFGICLAIFLEYLDNTVRTVDDVERMLRLPALAVIPTVGAAARRRLLQKQTASSSAARSELLINNETGSTVAEAYKQLRTSVLLSTAGRAPKTLLVTSGQPGEGKTTTTINTAISLAQTGAKVLVVDADMRRPHVHKVLGISNVAGLSTVLSRNVSEADIMSLIDVNEESGLNVMTSGAVPPNPAELLGSNQMKKLMNTLEPHFDFIVVDSPPIASVTDGVLLASMVDGVILVVHGGRTTRGLVRRARQLLNGVGARCFGVVLNNVKLSQHDYYYYQYYGKPYASADGKAESRALSN